MSVMMNNGQTLSGFISKLLKQEFNTLHEWETMSVSIINWLEEQNNGLSKYVNRLNEDAANKMKAYKTTLRINNQRATANFIQELYQSLLAEKKKNYDMFLCLKKVDKYGVQSKNNLSVYLQTTNELVIENEILLDLLLKEKMKTIAQPPNDHIKAHIQKDPLFRRGVEVLIKNNITQL